MKCPMCKGGRKLLKKEKCDIGYVVRLAICDKCNGTGEVKMTNEEWLRQANTEQLAEFLCNVAFENETIVRKFKSEWVKWLKEKHE